MAELPVNTLFSTDHETWMLLSPEPLEQTPPVKVLFTTYTGRSCDCSRARIAAPPRSGPVLSHRFPVNRELITLRRPPRSKMAPPPPPSVVCPVLLPFAKTRFWTVSRGVAWSTQCE